MNGVWFVFNLFIGMYFNRHNKTGGKLYSKDRIEITIGTEDLSGYQYELWLLSEVQVPMYS